MSWKHVAMAGVLGVILWLMAWQAPVVTLIALGLLGWLGLRALQAASAAEREDK